MHVHVHVDKYVNYSRLMYVDGVATRELAFQLSSLRPTFLDRVACDGTESSLLECGNAVLGEFTCFNQDFAGVACNSGGHINSISCGIHSYNANPYPQVRWNGAWKVITTARK